MLRRLPCRALSTHAWGNADCGQLGLPAASLQDELDTYGRNARNPQPIPALRHYRLLTASTSASHSAFVRADGTLFTCGHATSGQLGLSSLAPAAEPTPVPGLPRVAAVACGARHTLALSAEGVVYAFGANSHGQLGCPGAPPHLTRPAPVDALLRAGHRVVAVAAGDDFSVAVCDAGAVYTWGCADQGRLGHGPPAAGPGLVGFLLRDSTAAEHSPRLVRGLAGVKVAAVFAGKHHVVAVDQAGKAYSWGSGRHFQLGTGDEADVSEPVEAMRDLGAARVRKVAPGGMHSLVLTACGRVYAVGQNEHGCLGLGYGNVQRGVSELTPVDDMGSATDIAAGWHVSAAVLQERGRSSDGLGVVATWGSGTAGALGNGEIVDHWAPFRIRLRARKLAIGPAGASVLAYD